MTPPHTNPSSRSRRKAPPPRSSRRHATESSAHRPDRTTPQSEQDVGIPRPQERCVRHVLVVEDDPTFAKLLTHILRSSNECTYYPTVTDTVGGALTHLDAGAFDVIIADLGLPDSREYDTIESLTEAAPEIPLVILTGTAGEGVGPSLEAVRRGASYFLRKGSVDSAAVERGIHYATERKQLSDILGTKPADEGETD